MMRRWLVPSLLILTLAASCTSLGEANALLGREYYNLGNAYFDLKKFDQAARAYQTALSHTPGLKIATLNLARTKAELGDAAGALTLLTPLAASDPDNLVVAQQRAWLLYRDAQIPAAATAWLDLASRLPADALTQFNTAVVLLAAERRTEALAPLTRWNELDGQKPEGLLLLADLLAEQKKAAEAAEIYRKALATETAKPQQKKMAARSLAQQSEVLERFGEATESWTTALELPVEAGSEAQQAADRFHLGTLQLLKIEDYEAGLKSLSEAWKAGFKAADAWKTLLDDPALRFGVALATDLKAAGVTW